MMIHPQCWPRAPTSKIRPWAAALVASHAENRFQLLTPAADVPGTVEHLYTSNVKWRRLHCAT